MSRRGDLLWLRLQSETHPNHNVPCSEVQNIYEKMEVSLAEEKVHVYRIFCISPVWTSLCGMEKSAQQRLVRNKGFNLFLVPLCFVFLVVCSFSSVHPLISPLVWLSSSAPEITPLERQTGRQRLRQQAHQAGRQSHHPGDILPVACPQSPGGDLCVRVHLL